MSADPEHAGAVEQPDPSEISGGVSQSVSQPDPGGVTGG